MGARVRPGRENDRGGQTSEATRSGDRVADTADFLAQLRCRRDASRSLSVLGCGCGDPWHSPPVTLSPRNLRAARSTWHHLRDHGLMSEHIEATLAEGVSA